MAKGKKNDFKLDDNIKKKLDMITQEALKNINDEIVKDIHEGYIEQVDRFYRHYTPNTHRRDKEVKMDGQVVAKFVSQHQPNYRRTRSAYKASSGYNASSNRNLNIKLSGDKTHYIVGIHVDPSFITPKNPYSIGRKNSKNIPDKNWIFDRVYKYGIHGFTKTEAKEWMFVPNSKSNLAKNRIHLNRFGDPSQWRIPPKKAPRSMEQDKLKTPAYTMNKWYLEYKKNKKHLSEIGQYHFSNALKQHLK